MARTVRVDQELCIGCALCADTAPGVFRMTEDNLAEVFDPAGATEETIQQAIDACPVACITWSE